MRKIEVCVPTDAVEPLQIELAAAGILTGLLLPCHPFQTDWLPDEKEGRRQKTVCCKIELIISNRLVPRAIEIVAALVETQNLNSSGNFVFVSEVEASYQFEPPTGPKARQRLSSERSHC